MNRLIVALLILLLGSPAWAQIKSDTIILQNAANSTGPGNVIDVEYYNSIMFSVTMTGTATVTFETAGDTNSTAVSLVCVSAADTSRAYVTSVTSSGAYQCSVAGLQSVRARISAYSNGTITVVARPTTAVFTSGGGGGSGGTASSFASAFPGSGTAAGARDTAGNMQPLSLNGTGTGQSLLTHCDNCAGASDTTATGALGALNAAVSVAMAGDNGAAVEFGTGTLAGATVVPEVSTDGGTTWSTAVFLDPVTGAMSTSLSNPSASQTTIGWPTGGVSNVRVRVSAYTSGTVTANVRATANRSYVMNYGSDGTNIRPFAMTTGGLTKVDLSGTGANSTPFLVTGTGGSFPIPANSSINLSQVGGTAVSGANVVDAGNTAFRVNCVNGCATAADATATGSLAALNNTVSVAMAGNRGAAVEFATGTLAGSTIVPEISTDGGTTWSGAIFTDPVSGAISTSLTNPSALQYGITWGIGGVSHVRVRVSVFGSGSVTANMRATANGSQVTLFGSDGSNSQPLQVDGNKFLKINMAACSGCSTDGATWAAGTSSTSSMGAVESGLVKGLITCDNVAIINTASSGALQLVALSSGKTVYVCGWEVEQSTASATSISLVYGTGTNCATGTTTMSDTLRTVAGITGIQGKVSAVAFWSGMKSAASNAVCVNNSVAVQIDGILRYTQF